MKKIYFITLLVNIISAHVINIIFDNIKCLSDEGQEECKNYCLNSLMECIAECASDSSCTSECNRFYGTGATIFNKTLF